MVLSSVALQHTSIHAVQSPCGAAQSWKGPIQPSLVKCCPMAGQPQPLPAMTPTRTSLQAQRELRRCMVSRTVPGLSLGRACAHHDPTPAPSRFPLPQPSFTNYFVSPRLTHLELQALVLHAGDQGGVVSAHGRHDAAVGLLAWVTGGPGARLDSTRAASCWPRPQPQLPGCSGHGRPSSRPPLVPWPAPVALPYPALYPPVVTALNAGLLPGHAGPYALPLPRNQGLPPAHRPHRRR